MCYRFILLTFYLPPPPPSPPPPPPPPPPLQLVAQKLNAIGLIVPILIIASIIILPIIFHVIAGFEQYKTQSGHEKMTLIRSSFVRISTLLIYIIAAFSAIECTQSKDIQLAALNTFKNNTTYCLGSVRYLHFKRLQCHLYLIIQFTFQVLGDLHWSTVLQPSDIGVPLHSNIHYRI